MSLDELSYEALAEITSHLDIWSLLRLRLVSRHFSSLSHLRALELRWNANTARAHGSLQLFIRRHCALPDSPSVILRIEGVQKQRWCLLPMACACASLRKLCILDQDLDIHDAQVLVQHLPACLEHLRIQTHAKFVDDVAMARFKRLKHLTLKYNMPPGSVTAYVGEGITRLPTLQRLKLEPGSTAWSKALFKAPGLRSTSLQQLQIAGKPFVRRPDVEGCLPSLQEIWLTDGQYFPAWLHGQPVNLLKVYFNSFVNYGPESLDTTNLLCSHLDLYCREDDDVSEISVKWLLDMPRLKHLSIRVETDVTAELLVVGSLRPWFALLAKTNVHVVGAVELAETYCSEEFIKPGRVALRQNGHGLMCLCTSCKDQYLDCHEQQPIHGQMDNDPTEF